MVHMNTGVVIRVVAGVALLAYAVVAYVGFDKGGTPLLPAVVGMYLLIRGLTSHGRS